MRTTAAIVWEGLRTSLWFVPACMLVGAILFAMAAVTLDTSLRALRRADM